MPGIGDAVVSDVGERHARVGIAPAVRRADAAVAEGAGAGKAAEAAHVLGGAAEMRSEAAMHRHAHVLVDPVAGVVADGVLQQARRDQPCAVELAAVQHHLVERGHRPRAGIAAAARHAGAAEVGAVVVGERPRAHAFGFGLVHVGGAAVLAVRQADEELAAEAERLDDGLADDVAIVAAGHRLDQHGERPVRRGAVIVNLRARRELEREVAHHLAQPLVVGPRVLADHRVGEARLMGDGLQHGDVALGVLGELRHVVGDLVGEAEQAALGQHPQRDRGHNFGIRVEQP